MKLTELLGEGQFGPGSQVPVKIGNANWKAQMGTVENKRRPESIYMTISTWAKPKLSVTKASEGDADQDALAIAAANELDKELKKLQSSLNSFFDSLYFDPSSIIFTYDFAATRSAVGKAQFLEIEINIDTVNDIDHKDDPAPNPKTGKVEQLHFDQFKGPVKQAIDKILRLNVFANSKTIEFQQTKRG